MPKPELGTKRVCVACSARFYDLQKSPAICPKCGTEQPAELPKPRRAGGNVVDDKRPKKPAVADDADVEVEAVEDDAEEDVIEDASDLEDDADAIPDEIEVEQNDDERER
ncbi:TIGR02300 family protein [Acidisphaera sp. L21]|jgi:uncharacterized protein (TIGR02300 family)|uniref:TIGR02300 family protein n=1 Tax=Acidisphaera sp. L21 TaxID=1641851 RepID=UPI00131C3B4B|nr:TIGR02300 family protein [Acidisphaera sp. L21]